MRSSENIYLLYKAIVDLSNGKITDIECQRSLVSKLIEIGEGDNISEALSSGRIEELELQSCLVHQLSRIGDGCDIAKALSSGVITSVSLQRILVIRLLVVGNKSDIANVLLRGKIIDEELQAFLVTKLVEIDDGGGIATVLSNSSITDVVLQNYLFARLFEIGDGTHISKFLSSDKANSVELHKVFVAKLAKIGSGSDISKVLSSGNIQDFELQISLVDKLLKIGDEYDVVVVLSSGKVSNVELQRNLFLKLLDIGNRFNIRSVLSRVEVKEAELQRMMVARLLEIGGGNDIAAVLSSGNITDVELKNALFSRLLEIGNEYSFSMILSSEVMRDENELQRDFIFRLVALDMDDENNILGVLLSGKITDIELQRALVNKLMEFEGSIYAIDIFANGSVTDLLSLYYLTKKFVNINREYSDDFFFDIKLQYQIVYEIIYKNILNNYEICKGVINHKIFAHDIKIDLFNNMPKPQKVRVLNDINMHQLSRQNIVSAIDRMRMRGTRVNISAEVELYDALRREYAENELCENIDIANSKGLVLLLGNIKSYQANLDLELNDKALKQVLLTLGKVGSNVADMIFDDEGRYSQEKLDNSVVKLRNQPSWSQYLSNQEMKVNSRSGGIAG